MSINAKLLTGFLAVAAMTLIVGGIGLYGKNQLQNDLGYVLDVRIPDILALGRLNTERTNIRAQTLDLWVVENAEHEDAVEYYRGIQQQRSQSWRIVEAAWEELQQTQRSTERARRLMDELRNAYRAWRSDYEVLDQLVDDFVNSSNDLRRASLYRKYKTAEDNTRPDSTRMGEFLEQLIEVENAAFNELSAESLENAKQLERLMVVVTVAAVLLAIVLGVLINRSISGPLHRVSTLLATVAKGDFSVNVDPKNARRGDEIGTLSKSAEALISNMRQVIADLSNNAQTVASSATELSSISTQSAHSVQEMSSRTSTVAAAAEEASANSGSVASAMEEATNSLSSVASATEEMSATIGEIAATRKKHARSVPMPQPRPMMCRC